MKDTLLAHFSMLLTKDARYVISIYNTVISTEHQCYGEALGCLYHRKARRRIPVTCVTAEKIPLLSPPENRMNS